MKSTTSLLLLAALSPAIILQSSCAKTDKVDQAVQSTKTTAREVAVNVKDAAVAVKDAAVDSWDSLKDYTFDKREDFAAGLDRMADKCDAGVRAMNAKVTGLPDAAAREQASAVKEFNEARAYLKSKLIELRSGTADTWDDTKQQAVNAWKRTQAAYDKVKASSTS